MKPLTRDIVFSGDSFIPIASDCTTCPLFNEGCKGSVYSEDCATYPWKFRNDSRTARIYLKKEEVNYNHFVIARLRGLELDENHLKQLEEKIAKGEDSEDIEMLKRSAHDFQVAKEMEISLFEYLYREFNNVVQDEDLPF